MPLEIRRERGGDLMYIRATGPADVADWHRLTSTERESGTISETRLLVDVRERETLLSGEDALPLRELVAEWGAVAIVTRPGAQFGMGRMVDSAGDSSGTPARTFTDLEEAWAWLVGGCRED